MSQKITILICEPVTLYINMCRTSWRLQGLPYHLGASFQKSWGKYSQSIYTITISVLYNFCFPLFYSLNCRLIWNQLDQPFLVSTSLAIMSCWIYSHMLRTSLLSRYSSKSVCIYFLVVNIVASHTLLTYTFTMNVVAIFEQAVWEHQISRVQ